LTCREIQLITTKSTFMVSSVQDPYIWGSFKESITRLELPYTDRIVQVDLPYYLLSDGIIMREATPILSSQKFIQIATSNRLLFALTGTLPSYDKLN
jgi:hypothetical protein